MDKKPRTTVTGNVTYVKMKACKTRKGQAFDMLKICVEVKENEAYWGELSYQATAQYLKTNGVKKSTDLIGLTVNAVLEKEEFKTKEGKEATKDKIVFINLLDTSGKPIKFINEFEF